MMDDLLKRTAAKMAENLLAATDQDREALKDQMLKAGMNPILTVCPVPGPPLPRTRWQRVKDRLLRRGPKRSVVGLDMEKLDGTVERHKGW